MIEAPAQVARRKNLNRRVRRMLARTGFCSIYRADGTVIERAPAETEIEMMVQFAMENDLDRESSTRIYELYAEQKKRRIEEEAGATTKTPTTKTPQQTRWWWSW